ncbi:MAG: hypothetical protein J5791_06385 [Fibrobacter sp.]|nr:hypothetical protein [Fibrobacter sp.]
MDLKRKVALLAFWSLLLPTGANAYFSQNDQGEEVFSFLSTFDSPRNAALERAASAVPSTDPTIVQLNPAALRLPEGTKRIGEIHWQTGDMAENQGSISYTSSFKWFLYQISYNWLDYGSLTGYDEYGNETGKEYNPLSQLATATISFPMKHIHVGITAKFASEQLADDAGDRTAWGAAFDWGISWQSSSRIFGLAVIARDFGCLLRDYVDDGEDTFYPMSQTFGISAYYRPVIAPRLTIMAESDFPRYAEPKLNLAGEYALGQSFFIRAGFTRAWLDLTRDMKQLISADSRPDEAQTARMLSAGLGYNSRLFALDYAFSYLAQGLGVEHRIGLRIGF